MLRAIISLIAFQMAGEIIADVASVPIPGMVIGLLLLFGAIRLRYRVLGTDRAVPSRLGQLAKGLHDHLGLLFVPAGVGIMAHVSSLRADAFGLLATVLISTVMTIAVTAFIAGFRTERLAPNAIASNDA